MDKVLNFLRCMKILSMCHLFYIFLFSFILKYSWHKVDDIDEI
jgi:hypothetical protein